MTKIILASKSPRRQELIKGLELDYRLAIYDTNEDFDSKLKAGEIPLYLAQKKADAYEGLLKTDEILLTADTVVWINNEVLNKPANEQEAFDMLKKICGTTHQVFTGVCLKSNTQQKLFVEMSEVSCKQLNDSEILHYIQNYHPFDKAGSYGIQDWFGYTAVHHIKGCFYNIMGLPVSRIYDELKGFNKF